jgi:methionyl-tRNA formyltransferase
MKTVFMGSPEFALPALQMLIKNKYDINAVYTQPDKRTGRGQRVLACPVKQYAVEHGLQVIQPDTLKDQEAISLLQALRPDILVVAAYGQILPDAVLQIPKYKCINIHPSLLPKYRGPSPITAAIINGDATTGVTIMLIEQKLDSGPILNQAEIPLDINDNADSLSKRLSIAGADLLVKTIPGWIEGEVVPRIQDEKQASYTKLVVKEDGKLDWKLPALHLWRKVRAYYPWPGCFTMWKGNRLKIVDAFPLDSINAGNLGLVVPLPQGSAAVAGINTSSGILGLLRVQPEGKREMSIDEFVSGHRDFIGSVLT